MNELTLWICKAGNRGQREERMLENSVLGIGWEALGDLSKIQSRDELKSLYANAYPEASENRLRNHVGQILKFISKTRMGDLVVTPLKLKTRRIAVGRIRGEYQFRLDLGSDMVHTIPVEWIATDIPRTNFEKDLLYSFGAYMTFCESHAMKAEERVKQIATGKKPAVEKGEDEEDLRNIEEDSLDQITDFISMNFKWHEHEDLIASILKAQGYETTISPKGPDGGIDITASKGSLGLLEPRICVQVKAGNKTVGRDVYTQLKGRMSELKATHGLLTSWSGFKATAIRASKNDVFHVKLWGPEEILKQLFEVYPNIDPEMRMKLPLKRIWALSIPEELIE